MLRTLLIPYLSKKKKNSNILEQRDLLQLTKYSEDTLIILAPVSHKLTTIFTLVRIFFVLLKNCLVSIIQFFYTDITETHFSFNQFDTLYV